MLRKIILGPPGTGKTTKLLALMEGHLAKGVSSKDIAFLAFTRKAAMEAKARAKEKFNLKDEDLPYFKTLHSLAFNFLGVDKKDVMGYVDYMNICQMLGLTISSQQIGEDGSFMIVHTKGDRLLFLENLARATKTTLEDVWKKFPNDDIHFAELELLATTLADYKRVRNKLDFTDMIIRFNFERACPDLAVMILDEAQDLAPVQWDMIMLLEKRVSYSYMAGDDDQAIYNWAGADVAFFQALQGETEVLDKTYRLPMAVFQKSQEVITQVKHRKPKEFSPENEHRIGEVKYHNSLESINMKSGTWFLLARNIYLLNEYSKHCLAQGFLYESKYGNPVTPNAAAAIKYWEMLRKGENVTAAQAKIVYDFMPVRYGVKFGMKKVLDTLDDSTILNMETLQKQFGLVTMDIWHKALGKLKPYEKQYFIAALQRGEKMMVEPRIKINTIHGVKGGEADNVVLVTDVSKRTFEEYQENPDEELRVWYVGITRARWNLYILHPETPYFVKI